MKPKIFVTRMLPELVMEKLNDHFIVSVNPENRALTKEEIINGTSDCDILLCLLSDTIDSDIISCNLNLKGIVNYAVGFNNIEGGSKWKDFTIKFFILMWARRNFGMRKFPILFLSLF